MVSLATGNADFGLSATLISGGAPYQFGTGYPMFFTTRIQMNSPLNTQYGAEIGIVHDLVAFNAGGNPDPDAAGQSAFFYGDQNTVADISFGAIFHKAIGTADWEVRVIIDADPDTPYTVSIPEFQPTNNSAHILSVYYDGDRTFKFFIDSNDPDNAVEAEIEVSAAGAALLVDTLSACAYWNVHNGTTTASNRRLRIDYGFGAQQIPERTL